MKKLLSLCIICTLIISLCACSSKKTEKSENEDAISSDIQSQVDALLEDLCQDGLGSWTKVESKEISEEDQKIFEQATADLDGASYEAVELLATQVVAGENLCFLAQLTLSTYPATTKYSFVYIYQDLEGNATISEVVDLESE